MECMEARRALKSSVMTEMPMKTNNNYQQTINYDIWCDKGSDDFSIDEFFDLPNDNDNIKNSSFLQNDDDDEEKNSCHDDPIDDFFSTSLHFSPDLAIPVDDMQELELWSHLMDDSVPEVTTTIPSPNPLIGFPLNKTGFNSMTRFEPGSNRVPFIPSAVPVKPRTKRTRTPGNQTWFTGSMSRIESPSSSSSSSSPTSTLIYPNPVHDRSMAFTFQKPGEKKPKRKPGLAVNDNNKENAGPTVQRRCSHCQVTKTPQWRLGPNGPKSLCNACGVRFKSGRLFPEYRPACSPTFSSEIHSNSHRKVLEMRRKKETTGLITGSSSMIATS